MLLQYSVSVTKNKKQSDSKTLPFKHSEDFGGHSYATAIKTASSNKRDRGETTPQILEKKPTWTREEEVRLTTVNRNHIKCYRRTGQTQMQQHSTMLAAIAKTVQFNSEELKERKVKVSTLEIRDTLRKETEDMKGY